MARFDFDLKDLVNDALDPLIREMGRDGVDLKTTNHINQRTNPQALTMFNLMDMFSGAGVHRNVSDLLTRFEGMVSTSIGLIWDVVTDIPGLGALAGAFLPDQIEGFLDSLNPSDQPLRTGEGRDSGENYSGKITKEGWGWPLKPAGTLTSGYGWRASTNSFHAGIDIGAPVGTKILAAKDGKIYTLHREGTTTHGSGYGNYGNVLEIDHGNGIVTRYAHLRAGTPFVEGVTTGQEVKVGDHLGYVGSTGRSSGPHLHFEIREKGSFGESGSRNPENFLPEP